MAAESQASPQRTQIGKSVPLEIFQRIPYHRPQSSVHFSEIMQLCRRCRGLTLFRNQLVRIVMAHRKLGWIVQMMQYQLCCVTTSLRYIGGHDTRDCRCRIQVKFKTLRTLPSGHRIELGFFFTAAESQASPQRTRIGKSVPLEIYFNESLIIGHKASFVSVKSCNSVEDVWVQPCSKISWLGQEWHIESQAGQYR